MPSFTTFLKRMMPKSFYARSVLIIVAPMILTLCLVTIIFFDRHWSTMTRRLSYAVANETAVLVHQYNHSTPEEWEEFRAFAASRLNMLVSVQENSPIPPRTVKPFFWSEPSIIILSQELEANLHVPFYIDKLSEDGWYIIDAALDDGKTMVVQVSDKRLSTSTTAIFLLWMVGSGTLFFLIAAIFMRNQVRPIRLLAIAAEKFGKGQDVERFSPKGAREVRQAAAAFLVMRERIKRQIDQRTDMLSGVSHDLRTILTRMKLQLAMMEDNEDTKAIEQDIHDMEDMVEGYLAFARGDIDEAAEKSSLNSLIHDSIAPIRRHGTAVHFEPGEDYTLKLKPLSFKRCLSNLLGNAVKYGSQAWVTVQKLPMAVEIWIEDDGSGIPEENYDDVFKPFFRMDKARNIDHGGVGLGLSIAKDIAQAHGGDIRLAKSTKGGLKAVIRIPL